MASEPMHSQRLIATELLAALRGLPYDVDGPIFTQRWQFQAIAIMVSLLEQSHFTWNEWLSALSNELSNTP